MTAMTSAPIPSRIVRVPVLPRSMTSRASRVESAKKSSEMTMPTRPP